eukprot:773010-Amphidinium_carterae.4
MPRCAAMTPQESPKLLVAATQSHSASPGIVANRARGKHASQRPAKRDVYKILARALAQDLLDSRPSSSYMSGECTPGRASEALAVESAQDTDKRPIAALAQMRLE